VMETWCQWENARKGSSCGLDRIHGAGTPRVNCDCAFSNAAAA